MPLETTSQFATVILEHLELSRRNAALEYEMPLQKYMPDDPFENHPLFKSEEQARVEDTMDGVASIVDEPTSLDRPVNQDTFIDAPATETESDEVSDESLWARPRATSTGATDPHGRAAGRAEELAAAEHAFLRGVECGSPRCGHGAAADPHRQVLSGPSSVSARMPNVTFSASSAGRACSVCGAASATVSMSDQLRSH